MSDVKMTWRNKDRLFAKLRRLAPAMDGELAIAGQRSADEMASLARSFAPVRTEKLRDSIVVTPPGGTPPAHAQGIPATVPAGAYMVTAGDTKARYAHLVEFGTPAHIQGGIFGGSTHPGTVRHPFFFPAYRLVQRTHKGRASRAINKAVKQVTG